MLPSGRPSLRRDQDSINRDQQNVSRQYFFRIFCNAKSMQNVPITHRFYTADVVSY